MFISKMQLSCKPVRAARVLRTMHWWIGLLSTAGFLTLIATGLLVQHRERFNLERRTVSRQWLPPGYRPQDPDDRVRADIVLTDLHSGRLLGPRGPLLVDGVALAWVAMMGSGYALRVAGRRRSRRNS